MPTSRISRRAAQLLALFRFWNVIELLYPTCRFMGDVWTARSSISSRASLSRLPDAETNTPRSRLPSSPRASQMATSSSGAGRALYVLSMAARAALPFELRMIEGRPVVIALRPGDASVTAAGLRVGDVIVSVDGEPFEARIAHSAKYTAASNETWRTFRAMRTALTGDEGSTLRLGVQDASGATREEQVARTVDWDWHERTGPVWHLIGDDVGYVDLDRLENGDVDAMFAALRSTRAIVFDMRGYPNGTAWAIAPRLNVRHARVAAQFFEPIVRIGWEGRSTFFEQQVGSSDKPPYTGKTVMLAIRN